MYVFVVVLFPLLSIFCTITNPVLSLPPSLARARLRDPRPHTISPYYFSTLRIHETGLLLLADPVSFVLLPHSSFLATTGPRYGNITDLLYGRVASVLGLTVRLAGPLCTTNQCTSFYGLG